MRITKSIYAESVELIILGASRWRKVGIEAELEDGDDVVKASQELKKKVDEIQRLNNVDVDTFNPTIPKVKPDAMVGRMKGLIDGATSKKELDSYRSHCPKEILPELEAKYKKLKK